MKEFPEWLDDNKDFLEEEIKLTDYQKRVFEAMATGIAKNAGKRSEGYPADIEDIVEEVASLWNLRPPARKKTKAYWIESARDLEEACGEFRLETIKAVRHDFEEYMDEHSGIAPFIVEGPGSLIKVARAKSAELRGQPRKTESKYISGDFSEFIES